MSSSAVAQPATQGPDAPTTAVDPADRPLLTHRQILAIFAGLMAGMFLFAISVFMVGSLASRFSQSMYELAAFRAIQGLGEVPGAQTLGATGQ